MTPSPPCLDHDTGGMPSAAEKAERDTCVECCLIAGWWADVRPFPREQPQRTRSPVRAAAVAGFVDGSRRVDDWTLARTCERLLARHHGDVIEVRPARPRPSSPWLPVELERLSA